MRLSYRALFNLVISTLFSCNFNNDESTVENNGTWVILKDGESIDGYTRSGNLIYGGYLDSLIYYPSMSKVDIQTFEVCVGSGYARDKKRVYYPIKEICIDATTYGDCYFEDYIVKNADPKSFKYLHDGYAIDGKRMYLDGKNIKWKEEILKSIKTPVIN